MLREKLNKLKKELHPTPATRGDELRREVNSSTKPDIEKVKALIKAGADLEKQNKWNDGTALFHAASQGHIEATIILVEAGANLHFRNSGKAPFLGAASSGRTEIVKLMLSKDISIEEVDGFGQTALVLAAANGRLDTVQELLSRKANIEHRTNEGKTPLLSALSARSNKDVIRWLIDNGADIHAQDNQGYNALFLALSRGYEDIARELMAKGVGAPARDSEGNNLLTITGNLSIEIFTELLDKGLNPHDQDNKGLTILMRAVKNGRKDIVELLIERGVDIWVRDKERKTAFDYARENNKKEIMDLLEAKEQEMLQLIKKKKLDQTVEEQVILQNDMTPMKKIKIKQNRQGTGA